MKRKTLEIEFELRRGHVSSDHNYWSVDPIPYFLTSGYRLVLCYPDLRRIFTGLPKDSRKAPPRIWLTGTNYWTPDSVHMRKNAHGIHFLPVVGKRETVATSMAQDDQIKKVCNARGAFYLQLTVPA